jgi:hypothetical protein
MQNDFELWDQPLSLLNRTDIPYRQLEIPCCKECNECWLSPVEDQESQAFRAGAAAVEALDETVLCLFFFAGLDLLRRTSFV